MGTTKYWKGLDELNDTQEFTEQKHREFAEELSVDEFLSDNKLQEASTARRDFLKFLGFSVAAATIASCESPVVKAIPYAVKPEDVTPGIANWYASTYYDGTSYASILVKSREGRPIHIKGNKDKGFANGAVNPQIAGSVLGLYDSERLANPTVGGQAETWDTVDGAIKKKLASITAKGKKVVLLSNTVISPSTLDIIDKFKNKFAGANGNVVEDVMLDAIPVNTEDSDTTTAEMVGNNDMLGATPDGIVSHIQYDAVSYNGIRQANMASFGEAIIPDYDFSKAKVIVSVAADFLNSWLLPTQFTSQYSAQRNPDAKSMSRHFHFESNMSITGSNADIRGMIKPSDEGKALAVIYKEVTGKSLSGVDTASLSESAVAKLKMAAQELKAAKGKSLVVAGSNRKSVQVVANAINNALNNYGKTIHLNNPINLYQSQDEKMDSFIKDLGAGKVGAVITWGTNPVYSHARGEEIKAGLSKAELTVSMNGYADETASNCEYICPNAHALETWDDFSPKMSTYALAQPTIRPLHDTRPAAESLMIWGGMAEHEGKNSKNYYEHIRSIWKKYGFPLQTEFTSFEDYWNDAVHYSTNADMQLPPSQLVYKNAGLSAAAKDISKIAGGEWELALYQKAAIGVGSQANNPWLQEMPDPISKVTWDNYVTMAPSDMEAKGYAQELGQRAEQNYATVTVGDKSVKLPVYPQPGQMPGTVGIALGYGRGANGEKIGKAAYQVDEFGKNDAKTCIGANAFPLVIDKDYNAYNATVAKADGTYTLACTQTHFTVMARNSIVKETTFDIYKSKDKGAYNHQHTLHTGWNHDEKPVSEFDLWDAHPVEKVGHRWGMSIDLNSCIGCGSCLIACQSENNVPVVGRDEVRRSREMHWLRLDRYYAADTEHTVGTRDKETFSFGASEKPSENPKVVHMPMMCHHCNHAPCETVCPVAATTHSNEGLNQMTYNRCIGTRYCANNCPYKVRRFNWFNYPSYRKFNNVNPAQDDLGRMVLNPDVTVRTRGVMEKCSMCVQRIQEGKLVAKKEDRAVKESDVTTACADVCPTNAITMGDWNNDDSAIKKESESKRAYQVLEEVGVKPNIWYQLKVRNHKNEALDAVQVSHHGGGHGGHDGHEENPSHDNHEAPAAH